MSVDWDDPDVVAFVLFVYAQVAQLLLGFYGCVFTLSSMWITSDAFLQDVLPGQPVDRVGARHTAARVPARARTLLSRAVYGVGYLDLLVRFLYVRLWVALTALRLRFYSVTSEYGTMRLACDGGCLLLGSLKVDRADVVKAAYRLFSVCIGNSSMVTSNASLCRRS